MAWFGTWAGSWFGSWFGTTGGGGGTVPASGPDGRLMLAPPMDGVRVKLSWATDVIKSVSGLERRAKLMSAPRVTAYLDFDPQTDDEFAELRAEFFRYPDALRLVPLRWDALRVRVLDDVELTVPAGHLDAWDYRAAGQRVYVYNDEGEGYTGVIQTASPVGTTIELDVSPSGGTFLDSEVFIAPLLPAYIQDGIAFSREQVNAGQWTAEVKFTDFTVEEPDGVTLETFDGNYLLDDAITPLAESMAAERIAAGTETVDFGAVFRDETLRTNADIPRAHEFQANGRLEIQWWRAFLYALAGRFETFLLPTFRTNFVLFSALDGSNTIFITAELGGVPDYVTDWFPSPAHRFLRFEYDDGTILYQKVSTATDIGDGSQRLVLTGTVPVGTLTRISLAEKCRLATDDVTLVYSIGDRLDIAIQAIAVAQ